MGLAHQLSRSASEVTGLSEEELWVLVGTTAVVTTMFGVLRVMNAVLDLLPAPSSGSGRGGK